ncbi:MAG: hypothetical protein NTY39_03455 [Campylobacterales bacterium]|nr:hypothetical protein [Campylobacterales bacterium]
MARIAQRVRKNSRVSNVVINDADLVIVQGLMEGIVTVYDEKSSGGTDVPTPSTLRQIKLGVNRKFDHLSCTVTIKHMKSSKHLADIFADKATFDANFTSALPATGIRAIYA